METIDSYRLGNITYEEFQYFMWGSGQRLIEEIGEEAFTFYLLANEGEFYKDEVD